MPCIYVDNKTTCRCNVESVKNHNLQNKGVLKKSSENGHVYTISDSDTTNEKFILKFKKTGVKNTTIFSSLCNKHDAEIFKLIERGVYTSSKKEQILYSLKSILNEHTKVEKEEPRSYLAGLFDDIPSHLPDGYNNSNNKPSATIVLNNHTTKAPQ